MSRILSSLSRASKTNQSETPDSLPWPSGKSPVIPLNPGVVAPSDAIPLNRGPAIPPQWDDTEAALPPLLVDIRDRDTGEKIGEESLVDPRGFYVERFNAEAETCYAEPAGLGGGTATYHGKPEPAKLYSVVAVDTGRVLWRMSSETSATTYAQCHMRFNKEATAALVQEVYHIESDEKIIERMNRGERIAVVPETPEERESLDLSLSTEAGKEKIKSLPAELQPYVSSIDSNAGERVSFKKLKRNATIAKCLNDALGQEWEVRFDPSSFYGGDQTACGHLFSVTPSIEHDPIGELFIDDRDGDIQNLLADELSRTAEVYRKAAKKLRKATVKA